MSALMLELSCRLLFNAVEQGHLMMWPVSVSVLILSFTYLVLGYTDVFSSNDPRIRKVSFSWTKKTKKKTYIKNRHTRKPKYCNILKANNVPSS